MLYGRMVLLGVGALWLAGSAAGQGNLVMFDIPGFTITEAWSINQAGSIAGIYMNIFQPGRHGFIRDAGGRITSFDPPGSIMTWVGFINSAGAIAGYYMDSSQQQHGYVRDPSGKFTVFDPPDGTSTVVTGINDLGEITGWSTKSQPRTQRFGFLRHANGSFTSFQVTGFDTLPYRINAHGTIAGILINLTTQAGHGFVSEIGGKITSFKPPKSVFTIVSGLNAGGTIVGYYTDAGGSSHGFEREPSGDFKIFQDETPINLNDVGVIAGAYKTEGYVRQPNGSVVFFVVPSPGCKNTAPESINNAGVVTGWCSVSASEAHSFVRTP